MIGKRIKEARNKKGFTQKALANASGISRSYLAGVEAGYYNPSVKTATSIAKALRVSLASILEGTVTQAETATPHVAVTVKVEV